MFAAGDLACFPLPRTGQHVRIEHWRVAQEQAKIAAANMMGLERTYQGVPYFWTYHYGVRYEFFGHLPDQVELLVEGDLNEPKFVAAYLVEGRCHAIFSANRESETAKLYDLMERQGTLPWETFTALLTKE
jgi:NADPH-dependent 2,4-dienoyl-CoA reductase/sulfur reductase-like enzyme